MHWPIALNPNGNHPLFPTRPDGIRELHEGWDIADTWKQLEAVFRKGKVKAIGVSNASRVTVEKLLKTAEIKPAANQLELHLYNPDPALVEYLHEEGIQPQAYSPLGSTGSPLLTDEVVVRIAEKHKSEPGAVCLAYLRQLSFSEKH